MTVHAFADFELDLDRCELRHAGRPVHLLPKPFEVLTYLIRHRHRVVSSDELIDQIWDRRALSLSSVPTALSAIRKALGDDPQSPRFIKTVNRRGYRFIGTLRPTASATRHFVGRSTELARLSSLTSQSLRCGTQLALISGEAGIGKTGLASEFISRLEPSSFTAITARCKETEGAPPLWPWIQVVRRLASIRPLPSSPRGDEVLARLLSDAPPSPDPDHPGPSADFDRFRLFSAVAHAIAQMARQQPLVVVFDDLHCADIASQRLLAYAVAELVDVPLLVIATVRPGTWPPDRLEGNVFTHLHLSDRVTLLELAGLVPDEIRELIASTTGTEVDQTTATMLYEQTIGNPFLLVQLSALPDFCASLHSPGLSPLPASMREAIAAELCHLPRVTWDALQMAAVFGRDVPLHPLARALSRDPASLLQELEPALARRILRERPGTSSALEFRHLLLRDTIYDAIPAGERVTAHRRAALALEKLSADHHPAEIAHHFREAHLTHHAVNYLEAAGDRAAAHLAYDDAADYYAAALAALPSNEVSSRRRATDLLVRRGEAELRGGKRAEAHSTLLDAASQARRIDDGLLFARATLALAPDLLSIEMGVLDPTLIALLEEALELVPTRSTAYRSRLHARLSMALLWAHRRAERVHHSFEALHLAKEAEDDVSLAYALLARHQTSWGPYPAQERHRIARELQVVAYRCPAKELRPLATLLRITSLLELARVDLVDAEIQRMAGLAEELRDPYTRWYLSLLRATRALMEGRFEEARALAEDFLARGSRVGDANAPHSFGAQLAIQLWELDRLDEAIHVVGDFVRRFPHVPCWRGFLMLLLADANRLDEAKREFLTLTSRGLSEIVRDENWRTALMLIGDVAVTLGELEIVSEIYEELKGFRGTLAVIAHSVAIAGPQDHRLGIFADALGRPEDAIGYFEDALLLARKTGAIPWLAHAKYSYAKMMLRRGSRRDAIKGMELRTSAYELARAFKLVRLQRQLTSLT